MTDEDFVKAVGKDNIKNGIADSNENYHALCQEYIEDNSPIKVGGIYILMDTGFRSDYDYHRKKNRAFIADTQAVDYKTDGTPIIMAQGLVFVNGTHTKKPDDVVGTFKCIVHGSMGNVTFKRYTK